MLRAAEACTRVALLCRACRVCRVCRSCCTARRGVDAGGGVCRGAIRLTATGPSRRLPPGGYPVCGAVEDGGAAAHSLGCAGDTLHDTYLRKLRGYDTIISNSREDARATSRDPPTATRRVSAFTPRVRSGQCRVAFSLTLSHAFRVRPLRLGATRFAGPRGFVGPYRYIRWPRRGRHAAQQNNSGK